VAGGQPCSAAPARRRCGAGHGLPCATGRAALGDQRVDQHPAAARGRRQPAGPGWAPAAAASGSGNRSRCCGTARSRYPACGIPGCRPPRVSAGRRRPGAAHEAAAQGGPAVAGDVDQALGHRCRRNQGQRREHDEDGVDLLVQGELAASR
jgi:hypothetical protein